MEDLFLVYGCEQHKICRLKTTTKIELFRIHCSVQRQKLKVDNKCSRWHFDFVFVCVGVWVMEGEGGMLNLIIYREMSLC